MSGETVLVTGGTGVVGSALIDELMGEEDLACLVHNTPLSEECENVVSYRGSLADEKLGLGDRTYGELAEKVKAVIHCAAVVEFNADHKVIHGLNVRGTERILEFAADAGAPIIYTSSAFIDRADMLEGEEEGIAGGLHEYLKSKMQAEELVRGSGVPYAIIRPPLLFSDSRTGRITREQAFHKVLKGISTGTLPFLPWSPRAHADYMPQDIFAKALAGLLRAGTPNGEEYWATAGPEAIEVGELIETCVETMAEHGVEVDPVPTFDVEMVKRLIVPAFMNEFDERSQQRFQGLIALAMVFGTDDPFPCNWSEIPGAPPHPTRQQLREVLALTVERTWSPAAEAEELAKV
ncbi:MAG TPA: SDR family oxidoreductase [Thermoleophilaceae bacterium]|nr:SDR family oxidoreductase [Thermoleophilaceae bacterium]